MRLCRHAHANSYSSDELHTQHVNQGYTEVGIVMRSIVLRWEAADKGTEIGSPSPQLSH